jgi:hypothetical protein
MQHVVFATPLVIGAALKITSDVLLCRGFRHVRPPEEQWRRAHTDFFTGPSSDARHTRCLTPLRRLRTASEPVPRRIG